MTFAHVPTATGTLAHLEGRGNDGIKSETLLAYELGYRFQPTRGLSLDVAGFINQYDDLRAYSPEPPFFHPGSPPHLVVPFRMNNALYGQTAGVELAATARMTDAWRLMASYTWWQADIRSHSAATAEDADRLESGAPNHQFQIRSYWDITRNLEFNAALYFVDGFTAFEKPTPSHTRLDLNVVWHVKPGMDLSIGVQNLLDDRHIEINSERTPQNTEMERAFWAQLVWRF